MALQSCGPTFIQVHLAISDSVGSLFQYSSVVILYVTVHTIPGKLQHVQ